MCKYYPIKFHNFQTKSAFALVLSVLLGSILYHMLFITRANTIPEPQHEDEEECFDTDEDKLGLTIFTLNFTVIYFLLPGILNTLFNLVMLFKLREISKRRSKIISDKEGEHGKLDLATTITLVMVSFIHFFLVIPVVISGIYTRILFSAEALDQETLANVSNIFASLLNISALSNGTSFYVYFARVRLFRQRLIELFCWGH